MKKKGFTLVNLIIALSLVFLLAMYSFILLGQVISVSKRIEDKMRTTITLRNKMEEILALDFYSISKLNRTSFNNSKGLVQVFPLYPDLIRVYISLAWDKNRLPLVLETYAYDEK